MSRLYHASDLVVLAKAYKQASDRKLLPDQVFDIDQDAWNQFAQDVWEALKDYQKQFPAEDVFKTAFTMGAVFGVVMKEVENDG